MITRWWFQIFFYVHPYLGKIPILTNIFQMGWNHQLDNIVFIEAKDPSFAGHHNDPFGGKKSTSPSKKEFVAASNRHVSVLRSVVLKQYNGK